MTGQPSKTGSVRHVLYAQYVTTNQQSGAMSFIDVMDGMKVVAFPIPTRLFIVAMLRNVVGGFDMAFRLDIGDGYPVETPSIFIPPQDSSHTNVAIPTPVMNIIKPSLLKVSLLADGMPFYEDGFEFSQDPRPPTLPLSQSPAATVRQ